MHLRGCFFINTIKVEVKTGSVNELGSTTVLRKLKQCENQGISAHNRRLPMLPKSRNHRQISSCNTVVLDMTHPDFIRCSFPLA